MNWDIVLAKNGERTLQLNGVYIYSKYKPYEDALRWTQAEVDPMKKSYVLIGLGLGYHAEALAEIVPMSIVYVYYFDTKELEYAKERLSKYTNITLVSELDSIEFNESIQFLIPNAWIKALGEQHPLFPYLEDIKINQRSYRKYAQLMKINFLENIKGNFSSHYPTYNGKQVCLIAAGPSLDRTMEWLKEIESQITVACVGSALKPLLANGIQPDIVVISDAKADIKNQLENTSYKGDLFFLSTANHEAVKCHVGNRYIVFQQGYPLAEDAGKRFEYPLIETGGSVATATFSLLEVLGFQQIFLFGQDLGVFGERTHVKSSTSERDFVKKLY